MKNEAVFQYVSSTRRTISSSGVSPTRRFTHGEPLHADGPLLVQALPEWERAPVPAGRYRAHL